MRINVTDVRMELLEQTPCKDNSQDVDRKCDPNRSKIYRLRNFASTDGQMHTTTTVSLPIMHFVPITNKRI